MCSEKDAWLKGTIYFVKLASADGVKVMKVIKQ